MPVKVNLPFKDIRNKAKVEERADSTSNRRLSLRRSFDSLPMAKAQESPSLPSRQDTGRIKKRPSRWRGPQKNADTPARPTANIAAVAQSNTSRMREVKQTGGIQQPKTPNVELRFSFSADADESPEQEERNATVAADLSQLSVAIPSNNSVSDAEKKASPVQAVGPQPTMSQVPRLSKPKPKREGYGFSYSESFMYDSDEYPDTECEWEPEKESTESPQRPAPYNPYLNWDGTPYTGRPNSRDSATTIENQSFEDMVVLRDVGSFYLARPQRPLPCTRATREDTVRLKRQAKTLIAKFEESAEVQAQLLTRIERMLYTGQQRTGTLTASNPMLHCALKLRDFLLKSKEERIETGEHPSSHDLTNEHGLRNCLETKQPGIANVQLLSGGTANYVYRVTKHDGSKSIFKHAAPYLHMNKSFALDPTRMNYEAHVLEKFSSSASPFPAALESSNVHAVWLFSYDKEPKLLEIEDNGSRNFKDAYTDKTLEIPLIGKDLAAWLAALHTCSQEMSLKLPGHIPDTNNNPIAVDIYRHSYRNLHTPLSLFGHDPQLAHRIDDEFGILLATENECICHGNFWPGNVLVHITENKTAKMTIVDWEIVRRGTSATDVGQFAAEAFLLDRFRGGRGLLPCFLAFVYHC
ncbi:kinase [Pyrenophora tritici-repentis]|nr:kinase [Pyrenophora tritici-repentis]